MKQLVFFAFLFFLAFANSACKSKNSIPIDKMKVVFWDLALADEFTGYYIKLDTLKNLDSAINSNYYRVLAMHDVSLEDFNREVKFYTSNPDKYRILMDSVTAYGNRQREKGYERRYGKDPIEVDKDAMNQ